MPDGKIIIEVSRNDIKEKSDSEKLNFLIDHAFTSDTKLDKLNGVPAEVARHGKEITSLWGYIRLFFIMVVGGMIGLFFKK